MSTSGSADYAITRNNIFDTALALINLVDPSESADADQYAMCERMLNLMVKAWMSRGINLWAMKEATLFLSVGTQSYSLGPSGTHCTNSYVHTTLSDDEAQSSTSIGLESFTGMSDGDNIGIALDDGTIHWTTISGAPGATTTIASGLASEASAGNVVFAYTTKINRPQRIISAYRRDINDNDTPVELISRGDYSELAGKTSRGKPIQVFYDPQLTNGTLYTWPSADLATDVIRFWYSRPLEDFDAAEDNPDFPIEWGEALIYGLADRLAAVYQSPLDVRNWIKAEARDKYEEALSYDTETASVFFQPDHR